MYMRKQMVYFKFLIDLWLLGFYNWLKCPQATIYNLLVLSVSLTSCSKLSKIFFSELQLKERGKHYHQHLFLQNILEMTKYF